jgi:hypothetical protein
MGEKMSKKNKEKLFVEIDEQLKKDLIEKTERDKTTMANVVRKILSGYFKRQRDKQ